MNALTKGLCPCNSGKPYDKCCKMLHDGVEKAKNALELMMSRYSAYAMKQADYIINTTHPKNEEFSNDLTSWTMAIQDFMHQTSFENLKVLDFQEQAHEAFVIFQAILSFEGRDCSFTERSRFVKEDDKWYYESGEIFETI